MYHVPLTEFLTARLDEDEEWSRMTASPDYGEPHDPGVPAHHERILADIEAKRAILALHSTPDGLDPSCSSIVYPELAEDCETLQALTHPHADHPDYDHAWKL